MSGPFHVVPKGNGLFSVENETEVMAEVASQHLAQECCDRLNAKPDRNPYDVFAAGRYATRAARQHRPTMEAA